ncbi:hypothetical protein L2737_17395 [Shewanella electrodiphila]|uniref:Uncharacterized protein n=1 Tax=Shewanella electrodiphila TaxID=934143 RepID=A0ABT0KTA1_9GAMM|nr:hypothetical protein [Shewanella electrodiphila]MCL1047076.1 hypothetical protein [Shewanella electrodiphila]
MSVIHAMGEQWDKAEWSHQLVAFWQQDTYVNSLLVGATNATTIANLVAALIDESRRQVCIESEFANADVFSALFDCFLLLFVKEINSNDLSQAEALIVQITEHYAKQCLKQADPQANASNQSIDARQAVICNQSQKVITAMSQLSQLRHQRRSQSRNMGN